MSEISERQQLIDELQLIKERIKKIEDQLIGSGTQKQDVVDPKLEPTLEQDKSLDLAAKKVSVSSPKEKTEDTKIHDVLTIEGIINLINIRSFKPLKDFRLLGKIVTAATREGSQYGKTRPQEIIIADEKNQRFKMLNWHKSMDQKLKDHKDKWVIFDSVYLKENDRRFPDNQSMEFKVSGELRQYNIHSSKKFRIVIVKEKGE